MPPRAMRVEASRPASPRALVALAPRAPRRKTEIRRRRELGRAAEAAPVAVEALAQRRRAGRERGAAAVGRRRPGSPAQLLADRLGQLVAPARHARRAARARRRAIDSQHGREAGPAVAVLGREVGAGEERLQVGRQEHRVRPAALTASGPASPVM